MKYLEELNKLVYSHSSWQGPQLYQELVDDINNGSNGGRWDSLIINRRKPYTYRMFTDTPMGRLCLHKFDPCDSDEAFSHPHPWPGAFIVLKGAYRMIVGLSPDRLSKPVDVIETIVHAGSSYLIDNPMTWHSIQPLTTTYTVMLNGLPWPIDYAHTEIRTTKGKDLDKIPDAQKVKHLKTFRDLLYRFQRNYRFGKL